MAGSYAGGVATAKRPEATREPVAERARAAADGPAPDLDAALERLHTGAGTWARLTLAQREQLLRRVERAVGAAAEDWAHVAAESKGLDSSHPARGEEWLSGPYGVLTALAAYRSTLAKLAAGTSALDGVSTVVGPDGRLRVHAFPLTASDRLLLSGYTGEVWLEPGVTDAEARRAAGLAQLTPEVSGGVGLVLGAGNVTSIPVLDVLSELLAANRTVMLKLNPTQDALLPVFERALEPLVTAGFLRIVTGGGDVGAALAERPRIDHIHITGSAATFDTIVWGSGEEAERRRAEGRPRLTTPITAELGGVSPVIVVPGRWSAADLRYHAEHIATMRLYNSGHNCLAAQVVLVSRHWPQRDEFVRMLREAYDAAPARTTWYPGSEQRLAHAASDLPTAIWCAEGVRAMVEFDAEDDASALTATEFFAPVLGVIELPGNGQEFLDTAVGYANERLAGTLSAHVLIDPATEDALGTGVDRAIAALRYGGIAINSWTALNFLTPTLTWGGYPGATPANVQSGIGVVHNALLLDRVERSVTRGPFRPFPRSVTAVRRGRFSALPKPPWFVTSRTGAAVSEGFTRFRIDGDVSRLTRTMRKAFRA